MRSASILSIFTFLFLLNAPIGAQTTPSDVSNPTSDPHWLDWQTQLIETIDPDQISERDYARILETLYELELDRHLHNYLLSDSAQQPLFHGFQQQLILSADRCLNQREGYLHPTRQRKTSNQAYRGDPYHETLRYDVTTLDRHQGQWRAGLVLDKDAGEPWQGRYPWADSHSLYLTYRRRDGICREVVAGHYRLTLGNGLLCGQSLSLGKNMIANGFMEKKRTLAPHASSSETDFMQGAAVQLRLHRQWALTAFASMRSIDGTREGDTLRTWNETGYHRTQTEENHRHTAHLTQVGTRLQWLAENAEVAVNVLYDHFDHPFYRAQRYYNRHAFRGRQLWATSLDYDLQWMGIHFKGETACSQNGGWATLNGAQTDLGFWSATALYRYFSDHYHHLQGNALAESSALQGEQGVTLLLQGPLSAYWDLQTSADWFRFSLPQYRIQRPSDGYELTAKTLYHRTLHRHQWSGSLSYRWKAKHRNNPSATSTQTSIEPYYRQTVDATVQCLFPQGWTLRTQAHLRLQTDGSQLHTTSGKAIAQAVGYRHRHSLLRVEAQGAWFQSDNYDCRLYLTEKDVLYGFHIPMLQGEGWRAACTLSANLPAGLTIEAKYARTTYRHQNAISSGLQRIIGNHQDNLWLLARWNFGLSATHP